MRVHSSPCALPGQVQDRQAVGKDHLPFARAAVIGAHQESNCVEQALHCSMWMHRGQAPIDHAVRPRTPPRPTRGSCCGKPARCQRPFCGTRIWGNRAMRKFLRDITAGYTQPPPIHASLFHTAFSSLPKYSNPAAGGYAHRRITLNGLSFEQGKARLGWKPSCATPTRRLKRPDRISVVGADDPVDLFDRIPRGLEARLHIIARQRTVAHSLVARCLDLGRTFGRSDRWPNFR